MIVSLGVEMLKSGDSTSDSRKKNGISEAVSLFFCIFAEKFEEDEL